MIKIVIILVVVVILAIVGYSIQKKIDKNSFKHQIKSHLSSKDEDKVFKFFIENYDKILVEDPAAHELLREKVESYCRFLFQNMRSTEDVWDFCYNLIKR